MKEASPVFASARKYQAYALKYGTYKTSLLRLIVGAGEYIKTPQLIYDLCCGTGISTHCLAETFPEAHIIAVDKSSEMIVFAEEGKDSNVTFQNLPIEELQPAEGVADAAFCNAAFWYLDKEKALPMPRTLLRPGGIFAFNVSEPAIDFGDKRYDDRFLQTMVEVLDDFGIVFHREGGTEAGRLKLSYTPPTVSGTELMLKQNGFEILKQSVWEFTKPLPELMEFYSIPGFGTKAFRELQDEKQKSDILKEIVRRLGAEGAEAIRFRWAEFICRSL